MAGWPTTIDGMADKILRSVDAYFRSEFTVLRSGATASAGSLELKAGVNHAEIFNLSVGDVIETNAELHLITAITHAGGDDTLTVTNAWQGTTAAAHSSGDMVRINPRIARQDVYDAMESVILAWDDLFAVNSYTASANFADTTTRSAEVVSAPSDFKRVVKTLFKAEDDVWVPAPKDWFVRAIPTSEVTSGLVLQWEQPYRQRNYGTSSVTVFLAEYFDTSTWTGATDLLSTVGLSRSMLDVLFYGAMFTILMPEETQRSNIDYQAQPREAAEVPPGYLAQTALSFKALHDQRKQVEAAKLAERWKRD